MDSPTAHPDDEPRHRELRLMRPLPPFSSYPLLHKETLISANTSPERLIRPVIRLTFAYPGVLQLDATTHHVKVIRNAHSKPRTYTPIWPFKHGSFDLIIKVYEGGTSEWLADLDVGSRVTFIGPIPLPVKPVVYRPAKRAIVVALGVGITLGIAAVRKEVREGRSVCLVQAVRYGDEFIFEQELKELQGVEVVKVVSAEQVDGCVHGRVDETVLGPCLQGWEKEDIRVLVVGTKEMIKGVWGVIRSMGLERRRCELVRKGFQGRGRG